MLDSQSKYRLIGAGILLVASAILLPLVLDGERPSELDVVIDVPDKPAFPEVAIAPAQPVDEFVAEQSESMPDVNSIELISDVVEPSSIAEQPRVEAPVVKQDPTPEPAPVNVPKKVVPIGDRWTLQVATFGKQENASRTLKRLQDAGYPAYVMTSNSLFKVFVGPELKREASEQMKEKVKREFKLSGIVVKYSPNS